MAGLNITPLIIKHYENINLKIKKKNISFLDKIFYKIFYHI